MTRYTVPIHLPVGAVLEIRISGVQTLSPQTLPVHTLVALGDLPVHDATLAHGDDLAVPSLVSWPAGRRTLKDAVESLGANGNQVDIASDVDITSAATVSEFHGCFWQAALRICADYHVAMHQSALRFAAAPAVHVRSFDPPGENPAESAHEPTCLVGGPLLLEHQGSSDDEPGNLQVCGLALVGITQRESRTLRGLAGLRSEMFVSFTVRLEPRMTLDQFSNGSLNLLTGGDGGNAQAQLCDRFGQPFESDASDVRVNSFGQPFVTDGSKCRVDNLPSHFVIVGDEKGMHHVVQGQLVLGIYKILRADFEVRPGDDHYVRLGGKMMKAILSPPDESKGLKEFQLTLDMVPPYYNFLQPVVTDAAGEVLNHTVQGQEFGRHIWNFKATAKPPLKVTLSNAYTMGDVVIPLTFVDLAAENRQGP